VASKGLVNKAAKILRLLGNILASTIVVIKAIKLIKSLVLT
jgi:hypothetical protein